MSKLLIMRSYFNFFHPFYKMYTINIYYKTLHVNILHKTIELLFVLCNTSMSGIHLYNSIQ